MSNPSHQPQSGSSPVSWAPSAAAPLIFVIQGFCYPVIPIGGADLSYADSKFYQGSRINSVYVAGIESYGKQSQI